MLLLRKRVDFLLKVFLDRGKLRPFSYVSREMQPNDVDLEIQCCGVCHSGI
jgi:D-arabinose 1-dehydrogenase-like Zn-dependent alcohol dehydrogenase